MLNVRDLYEAELARCRATFDSVNWTSSTVAEKHLRCTECGSDLAEQRDSTNTDQEKLELVCRGCGAEPDWDDAIADAVDRSEEHTSELQSLMRISYAVFSLKKK